MLNYPKVAVVYLSYHSQPFLDLAIEAWKKINYPRERWSIIVVDNPHPQYGSAKNYLEEKLLPLAGRELPEVAVLAMETNLGFAGGNNIGVNQALDDGADYVFLHNQDGLMAPDCLMKIVEAMEADKSIGVAQSLVLLYPETDLINTAGNKFHYLGFGYCGDYRHELKAKSYQPASPAGGLKAIGYASGAAMLLRVDLLRQYSGLDEDFFTYHEDLEYSLRLKALGYKIALAPESIFYHQHDFNHNPEKFYFMERNRFGLWLMYFKWPTLLLFLPMELLVEVGLFFFALKNRWLKQWARVYGYWFRPDVWRLWFKKRARIQEIKKFSDRELLRDSVSQIEFEGANGAMIKFGDVLMRAYWQVVKYLIRW